MDNFVQHYWGCIHHPLRSLGSWIDQYLAKIFTWFLLDSKVTISIHCLGKIIERKLDLVQLDKLNFLVICTNGCTRSAGKCNVWRHKNTSKKGGMREEVGKETPKKDMENRCIFMTSHFLCKYVHIQFYGNYFSAYVIHDHHWVQIYYFCIKK